MLINIDGATQIPITICLQCHLLTLFTVTIFNKATVSYTILTRNELS